MKEGRISHEKRQLQEQKRHWRGRIQIEWHVCPADTSLQILHKVQDFMSETEHVPESFPNRIIFTSMFDDITDCVSKKVHGNCLDSAKEVASFAARFKLGCWCFCGPGSEQTWKNNEARLAAQFAYGEWDKVASVMTTEYITSKHPVFKCSNMRQTGILTSKTGKPEMHFKSEPQKNLMLVHVVLGVQSALAVIEVKIGLSTRCQFSFLSPTTI